MLSRAQVHEAAVHANHGGYAWDRAGTYYDGRGENRPADMGSTDNSGRVSWKQGGWTETWEGTFPSGEPYAQVTTCTYGWCGSGGSIAGTLNGCIPDNQSEAEWGYSYGACNSSAWGQRFAGYLAGVERPAGSGDMVHADYAAGASGTTTFGYHPYWAVTYNGNCRIYQGWSYTGHNCFDEYVVAEASVCGDGFCDDTDETCGNCAADCGACPACGNGTCDYNEDCGTCVADCGECRGGGSATCQADYSTSSTSSASYSDSDTVKLDVFLTAGVEYVFSTCDSGSGDTYLRLHKDGSQVAYNDDACSTRSSITYTPSTTGTYELSMGCYSSSSCSGPVDVTPGDGGDCTGVSGGGGGGGCTPSCTGDQCGQADGCGGTCPDTDANTCGMCGNGACATDELHETGLSGSSGSTQYFQLEGSNPTFHMFGGSGDADLYVRLGQQPTTSNYDCRPYTGGNDETCTMSGTGTWFVMVRGYSSFSGVTLTGTSN